MTYAYEKKSVWSQIDEVRKMEIMAYSERYKEFLDASKTERLAVKWLEEHAAREGFKPLDAFESLKPGDRVYFNQKGKAFAMVVVGEESLDEGMHIVGAHIDSPRLDLKQRPFYEDGAMLLAKTHYYGGVKKYQWTTIPLALHGVIYTQSGEKIELSIGEEADEPVFFINDLLIHLSADQMQKKLAEGITGEQLNIVLGHSDFGAQKGDKDPIKKAILSYLHDRYGLVEEDFAVAEIEVVPAGKARSVGFDEAMLMGYGHDDRVCAYATYEAILGVKDVPRRTAVALFLDKEEIGSVGNAGATSRFFENLVAEMVALEGGAVELGMRRALRRSQILSADVSVSYEPNFPEVTEKLNACIAGCGVAINKYTGARGKSGCNDANAEFLQEVRTIFAEGDVIWQTGEMGAVDQGGGGTIAGMIAEYGAEVVDCGVPTLSMHAPYELVSKADAYMAKEAYRVFFTTRREGIR